MTPPLPHHPESHTYAWTKLELAAILKYGEACAAAERERICATMSEEFEAWAETHALSEEARGYGMVQGAWQDAWAAATERAAKSLDDAADALMPPGKRGNAVDRHCADVLRGRAAAIRGGERAA